MIVAEMKPIEEITEMIKGAKKVLVAGCGGCVTVCLSGGQKETDILASALRMKQQTDGAPKEIVTATYERQCDPEYVVRFKEHLKGVDLVVSMACGLASSSWRKAIQRSFSCLVKIRGLSERPLSTEFGKSAARCAANAFWRKPAASARLCVVPKAS